MAKVQEAYLKNLAIRKNFATLACGMEADRVSIASQCYSKGLVPQGMLNATPRDLLNALQSQVAADGTGCSFEAFCNILKDEVSTQYLAQGLLKTLQLLRKREKRKLYTKPKNQDVEMPFGQYFDNNEEYNKCDFTSDTSLDDSSPDDTSPDSSDDKTGKPEMGHLQSVADPGFESYLPTCSADHTTKKSDHKCWRHRSEVREFLLSERRRHQHAMKLVKSERREHIRKLKSEVRHLRMWLKESLVRENQLNKRMQYMDLYYEEIKGDNSKLHHNLQVRILTRQ